MSILSLFAAALVYGQFASGVNLVEVYATVTDRQGIPITDLNATDFTVVEDGQPRAISAFAVGDVPLAIAIGIDRSFSMSSGREDRLGPVKSAARALVAELRPDDLVMIVAIGSETEVAAPLSADKNAAARAIDAIEPWGTTPLYDAAAAAIDAIESAKGRRALVLLSDGTDRYSEIGAAELLERARRHDALVYPIAVSGRRPPVFAELAAATGGRSFAARGARELTDAVTAVARELRHQYLLGYVPPPRLAPGWHAIDVTVNRPGARVRARDGYFAR